MMCTTTQIQSLGPSSSNEYSVLANITNISSIGNSTNVLTVSTCGAVPSTLRKYGELQHTKEDGTASLGNNHCLTSPTGHSYHSVVNSVTVPYCFQQVPLQRPEFQCIPNGSFLNNYRPLIVDSQPVSQSAFNVYMPTNQVVYYNGATAAYTSELKLSPEFPLSSEIVESSHLTADHSSLARVDEIVVKHSRSDRKTRKLLRNRGESYISTSGKLVSAKQYVDKDCQCKIHCFSRLGILEDRKEIFRKFWHIGKYTTQNAYLAESVLLIPTKAKRKNMQATEKAMKTVTRLYFVKCGGSQSKIRVCKRMFLNLHGISNGRLDRVLQRVNCGSATYLQDHRGHHPPSNRTSEEAVKFICEHIDSLKSVNLGSCVDALQKNNAKNVSQQIPLKKFYEHYKTLCSLRGLKSVSFCTYRKVQKTRCELVSSKVKLVEVPPGSGLPQEVMPAVASVDENTVGIEIPHLTQEKRKARRNSGEEYITSLGKLRKKKSYVDSACGCRYKCIPEIGTEEDRKQIFDMFWKIGDFNKQNEYISGLVTQVPIKHRGASGESCLNSAKIHTRNYRVIIKPGGDKVRVCKVAFLQLHGVSNGRLNRVLQAVASNTPHALQDQRGRHTPANKTKSEDLMHLISHIQSSLENITTPRPQNNFDHDDSLDASALCRAGINIKNSLMLNSSFDERNLEERFKCQDILTRRSGDGGQSQCHMQDLPSITQKVNVGRLYCNYMVMCEKEGRKPLSAFIYRRVTKQKFSHSILIHKT